MRAIAWEGRILVVGFASGDIAKVATNLILVKNFSVIGVLFGAHFLRHPSEGRRDFETLFEHHASGRLNPRIWKTFALEDAASALREITSRQVIGKMVLTV